MTRDRDLYWQGGYTRAQSAKEQKLVDAMSVPHLDGSAVELMARSLPKIPITLRGAQIRPHIRELGRLFWQEGCLFTHIQDGRLTEREREFLAGIGTKLNGGRAIV